MFDPKNANLFTTIIEYPPPPLIMSPFIELGIEAGTEPAKPDRHASYKTNHHIVLIIWLASNDKLK